MTQAKGHRELTKIAKSFPGATVVSDKDNYGEPMAKLTVPEGQGVDIILTFYKGSKEPRCETRFRAKGGEYSFDRLGVEDSFYFEDWAKLPQQVSEQVARAKKRQEHLANTTAFNLGPVTLMLTPEGLDNIVKTLQAGKTYTYHPSGFGTGYYFSTNARIRNRFDRAQASKELVQKVGKAVYISSFDAD